MKIRCFHNTDAIYVESNTEEVVESRDLDENTVLDLDRQGNLCTITIEHASDIMVRRGQSNGKSH